MTIDIKALKNLAKRTAWSDDSEFNVSDYSGGNFDDTYSGGFDDGETYLARKILKQLGVEV